MKHDFKDVKVGDQLLVERYHYSDRSYYTGKVIKVTGTRFTVDAVCFGQGSQVFTKDGNEYPRRQGYGSLSIHLKPLTSEGKLLVKKYHMSNKARDLAHKLTRTFESANFREGIVSMELSHEELDESIKLLEGVLKSFEKYAKEKL